MKTLPALLASLVLLPAQAQTGGVGRLDQTAQKQLSVDFKSCAKPVWPKESLRREETGRVTLEFLIGLDGSVVESKVLQSSGFPLLDFAAQDGLAKCKFTPPSSVGRTEPTRTKMQYVWTLKDDRQPPPDTSPAARQAHWESQLAAAHQGKGEAQWVVGMGYLLGTPPAEKNSAEGIRWLRAAADQGELRAMETLAMELLTGRHVARDEQQALELLEKAAAQGSGNAELWLAMALMAPKSAVPDEARARALLERALAGGNKHARMPLAHLLLKEGGASTAEALRLMHESADEHDRMAQYALASMYEKGEYVAVDRAKALALYERAAAAGWPYAKAAVARLKPQEAK